MAIPSRFVLLAPVPSEGIMAYVRAANVHDLFKAIGTADHMLRRDGFEDIRATVVVDEPQTRAVIINALKRLRGGAANDDCADACSDPI